MHSSLGMLDDNGKENATRAASKRRLVGLRSLSSLARVCSLLGHLSGVLLKLRRRPRLDGDGVDARHEPRLAQQSVDQAVALQQLHALELARRDVELELSAWRNNNNATQRARTVADATTSRVTDERANRGPRRCGAGTLSVKEAGCCIAVRSPRHCCALHYSPHPADTSTTTYTHRHDSATATVDRSRIAVSVPVLQPHEPPRPSVDHCHRIASQSPLRVISLI